MDTLLHTIGIPIWRLRTEIEACVPSSLRYVFIADPAQADHSLLNNILKALSCTLDEVNLCWFEKPEAIEARTWDQSLPLVVFGESFHAYAPDHAICTVSLTALNQNLPAKKALWQRLKP